MTYTLKCIATDILSRKAPTLQTETELEHACAGSAPPKCAEGDVQIAPLYAEAAGAYQRGHESRIAYNVVRTCDQQRETK